MRAGTRAHERQAGGPGGTGQGAHPDPAEGGTAPPHGPLQRGQAQPRGVEFTNLPGRERQEGARGPEVADAPGDEDGPGAARWWEYGMPGFVWAPQGAAYAELTVAEPGSRTDLVANTVANSVADSEPDTKPDAIADSEPTFQPHRRHLHK